MGEGELVSSLVRWQRRSLYQVLSNGREKLVSSLVRLEGELVSGLVRCGEGSRLILVSWVGRQ